MMQVPPASAAAQAAGAAAQITAKGGQSSKGNAAQPAQNNLADIHVEHSGASDADRDAQGQGDGLTREDAMQEQSGDGEQTQVASSAAVLLPGEEPGQLDIIG